MTEATQRPESEATKAASLREFRVSSAIWEDLAFALEVGDSEVLTAVVKRHGVTVDAFNTGDVPPDDRDPQFRDMPEILVVSMSFGPDATEMLLALPALLSKIDGIEIAIRIAASGKAYSDRSAISVELSNGSELVLFGGWDASPDEANTYILGHRYDLPMGRPISSATH